MSQGRGVRDALKSIVPAWLADRADDLNKGFKVLWVIAQMADGIVQTSIEGVKAALPGLGTPTALALIGASRRILRGVSETDDEYAARLRTWLDVWTNAASDEVLLQLLQGFLGPDIALPKLRLITRAGHFTTLNVDGSFTYDTDTDWTIPGSSWDTFYQPHHDQWWSDIWIVVYVNASRWPIYTSLTDPAWTAIWGAGTLGLGHQVPREAAQGVMSIIADMKGAHTFVQAVIFTTDTALYVPGALGGTGDPDGRWGSFSAPGFTSRVQAGVRTMSTGGGLGAIRYWTPYRGG